MLHRDGRQKNYFSFFAHLKGILGLEISNIKIIIGTDDERAITNVTDMAFPASSRNLCTKHIKSIYLDN